MELTIGGREGTAVGGIGVGTTVGGLSRRITGGMGVGTTSVATGTVGSRVAISTVGVASSAPAAGACHGTPAPHAQAQARSSSRRDVKRLILSDVRLPVECGSVNAQGSGMMTGSRRSPMVRIPNDRWGANRRSVGDPGLNNKRLPCQVMRAT